MLLLILVILFTFLYFYITKSLSYWENKRIPHKRPSFLGVFYSKQTEKDRVYDEYNSFPNERYYGIYRLASPILVIRDPDLIKKVTVKWFDAFGDHREFAPKYVDPIWAKNIFATKIEDGWQDLRTTLSPSFTSSKLKMMYGLMQKCAEECVKHHRKQEALVTVDAKDMFSRFTVDVIGTTTFGVTSNSFEDPKNEFYMMAKQTADFTGLKAFKFLGYALIPRIMKLFEIRLFNQTLVKFYSGLIDKSVSLRREKKLVRNDLIHLFMEAQKGQLKDDDQGNKIDSGFSAVDESDILKAWKKKAKLTDNDITGVGLGFLLAGFDTASNLMSFLGYELAVNPDVQQKLFKEVSAVPRDEDGKISYENLLKIKYLDMVVSEAFRKWPAGYYFDRQCIKPFTIEPENEYERPLQVEKGTTCFIPVFNIQRDSKYHPNPEKFDPERFSDENKHNINPFTYIPFSVGPRNCMGSRFALLEIKLLFAEIISAFEIVIADKMKMPMNIESKGFNYFAEGGMWLGLKPREVTA